MGAIDQTRVLQPVDADKPCGGNLEYDPDFLALNQAAQGRPEREMGSQVIPAEDPNWKEVKRLSLQLLARTKDLRVVVPLCRALIHTDGLAGFSSGLEAVKGLLEQYWQGLYPALDHEDNDDPTMRVNVLMGLCDHNGLLRSLRETPLVSTRATGSFSLRDVDVAAQRLPPPPDTTPPTAELIRAAFLEVGLPELQATAAAVQAAKDALSGISGQLDKVLNGQGPNLAPLAQTIEAQSQELARHLQSRGIGQGPVVAGAGAAAAGNSSPGGPGEIRSREDVIVWLDRICDFFARNEPSSPVPILLHRARNLINKSFLDVIRDLVPDALSTAEGYRGRKEEAS
jgi:type VI secretion system protein ImpA